MSQVLPQIVMPPKEPEPEPQPIQKIHSEVDNGTCDLPEITETESKEDIVIEDSQVLEEEIFDDPPKVVSFDEPPLDAINTEFLPSGASGAVEKKGKRKYVRKQPMSQKQSEHLARIRAIAVKRRAEERERKAQVKEDALVEKAEQKIMEKKKKKEEAETQRKKEEENPAPTQEKVKSKATPLQTNSFTKEDLDDAVLSAITSYDQLRKKQKSEKKIQQQKDMEEEKMKRTIQQAIQPQPVAHDPWRGLFT
jgi:hypothetical protein